MIKISSRNIWKDSPRQERAKAKKTDEVQPDDEEIEEEDIEIEETETKSTSRPASKMDLEEPIETSKNDDDDDEEEVIHELFNQSHHQ